MRKFIWVCPKCKNRMDSQEIEIVEDYFYTVFKCDKCSILFKDDEAECYYAGKENLDD